MLVPFIPGKAPVHSSGLLDVHLITIEASFITCEVAPVSTMKLYTDIFFNRGWLPYVLGVCVTLPSFALELLRVLKSCPEVVLTIIISGAGVVVGAVSVQVGAPRHLAPAAPHEQQQQQQEEEEEEEAEGGGGGTRPGATQIPV